MNCEIFLSSHLINSQNRFCVYGTNTVRGRPVHLLESQVNWLKIRSLNNACPMVHIIAQTKCKSLAPLVVMNEYY